MSDAARDRYDQREKRDELARRREHSAERPPLTKREREERWPIG